MKTNEEIALAKGSQPRWQIWAMIAVLIGCVATLAATLYDIA